MQTEIKKQMDLFSGINDLKFQEYHKANPEIYNEFVKYTLQSINKDYKHFSAEFIFNIMRWHSTVGGSDEFKINNNFKPFYARMFMNQYPHYKGFFKTRKSKAD